MASRIYYEREVLDQVDVAIAGAVDEIIHSPQYLTLDHCEKIMMIEGVYLMAARIMEHFDDEKKEEEK